MASSTACAPSLSGCSLRRHSSEIRTGCANQRPSGSVRGAASNGCPYRDRQLAQNDGKLSFIRGLCQLRLFAADWGLLELGALAAELSSRLLEYWITPARVGRACSLQARSRP